MIVLYIFLAILLILTLILLIPLKISIDFSLKPFDLKIILNVLFLKFTIFQSHKPENNESEQKNESAPSNEEKAENKNTNKLKDFFTKYSISDIFLLIKQLFPEIKNFLKKLLKHLTFKNLRADVCFVGDDSCKTSLYYGYACSLSYPILTLMKNYPKKYVNPKINVNSGFMKKNTQIKIDTTVRIIPLFLLYDAFICAIKCFKIFRQNKKS